MRRKLLIGCIAACLAGTAVAAEAPEPAAERPQARKVTLQWQSSETALGKAERVERGIARRGAQRLPAPELPPLRAWKRPDGTEEISHGPSAEHTRHDMHHHDEEAPK